MKGKTIIDVEIGGSKNSWDFFFMSAHFEGFTEPTKSMAEEFTSGSYKTREECLEAVYKLGQKLNADEIEIRETYTQSCTIKYSLNKGGKIINSEHSNILNKIYY